MRLEEGKADNLNAEKLRSEEAGQRKEEGLLRQGDGKPTRRGERAGCLDALAEMCTLGL